jgi:hypothetical protein
MPVTRTSGQGRPKGALNKDNADIRAMVVGALKAVGGQEYLAECAISHPVAFLGLVGKVMPLQIAGRDAEAFAFDFQWASAGVVEAHKALTCTASATVDADVVEAPFEPEAPLETQPQRVNPKRR